MTALTSQDRRYVLYYLRAEETAALDDIARQVIAWKENRPPERITEAEFKQMQVVLYHDHLPTLAEAHLIDFDDRSKTARYNYVPAYVETFITLCATIESPRE